MYDKLKEFLLSYIDISDQEWVEISGHFKPLNIARNEFIIREGKISKHLYFINDGILRSFYQKDGFETTRYFACENEFGAALTSFLTQQPTVENIQALEDCSVLQLSHSSLQTLYKSHPILESFFRQLFQDAYVILTNRIEGLITKTAEERYNDFVAKYPKVVQRLPQYALASYLNMTREFLSKIRNDKVRKK